MADPQIPLRVPDGLKAAQLTELCTSEHPNHRCLFQLGGHPYFWIAWCAVCDRSNDEGPPSDIDADYLAQANKWAAEAFAIDEAKRAERKRKRAERVAMKESGR